MLFYIDAGSGSMIAQAVVAGVAGAAVVAKVGWRQITSPLRRNKGAEGETQAHDAAPADETATER